VELSSGMEKNHFFAIIHEKLHRGDYLRFGRIIFIGNPNSSSYSHLCIFLSSIKRRIPCGLTGRQRFFGRHLKNPLSCLRPMLRCPREARLSCWKPIASKILLTMSREPFFLRPWQIKSAHLPMARLASPSKSLSECRCSRQDVPVFCHGCNSVLMLWSMFYRITVGVALRSCASHQFCSGASS
jgi:hypothetical protein